MAQHPVALIMETERRAGYGNLLTQPLALAGDDRAISVARRLGFMLSDKDIRQRREGLVDELQPVVEVSDREVGLLGAPERLPDSVERRQLLLLGKVDAEAVERRLVGGGACAGHVDVSLAAVDCQDLDDSAVRLRLPLP